MDTGHMVGVVERLMHLTYLALDVRMESLKDVVLAAMAAQQQARMGRRTKKLLTQASAAAAAHAGPGPVGAPHGGCRSRAGLGVAEHQGSEASVLCSMWQVQRLASQQQLKPFLPEWLRTRDGV